MSTHRVYVDRALGPADIGSTLLVEGDEARHALGSKRLTEGDGVLVLDGLGRVAECVLDRAEAAKGKRPPVARLVVRAVREVPAVVPRVRVLTPIPKADRLSWMLEQLSQAGAAAWAPLTTQRSIGDARDLRPDRLARIAREAAKQCGRAYVLAIEPGVDLGTLDPAGLRGAGGVLVADSAGSRGPVDAAAHAAWSVLVGPEGGFAPDELARLQAAGVPRVALGPHVMRIETAALAAATLLLRGAAGG